VDAEGRVRSCRHGDPIGKVGDSIEVLTERMEQVASAAAKRRGCADCANAECPRCPFPGLDDQAYCRLIKDQARVLRLLNLVHAFARLPWVLSNQRDRIGGD
jgi:hypothetical protein